MTKYSINNFFKNCMLQYFIDNCIKDTYNIYSLKLYFKIDNSKINSIYKYNCLDIY